MTFWAEMLFFKSMIKRHTTPLDPYIAAARKEGGKKHEKLAEGKEANRTKAREYLVAGDAYVEAREYADAARCFRQVGRYAPVLQNRAEGLIRAAQCHKIESQCQSDPHKKAAELVLAADCLMEAAGYIMESLEVFPVDKQGARLEKARGCYRDAIDYLSSSPDSEIDQKRIALSKSLIKCLVKSVDHELDFRRKTDLLMEAAHHAEYAGKNKLAAACFIDMTKYRPEGSRRVIIDMTRAGELFVRSGDAKRAEKAFKEALLLAESLVCSEDREKRAIRGTMAKCGFSVSSGIKALVNRRVQGTAHRLAC